MTRIFADKIHPNEFDRHIRVDPRHPRLKAPLLSGHFSNDFRGSCFSWLNQRRTPLCAYAHIFQRQSTSPKPSAVGASDCPAITCILILAAFSNSIISLAFVGKSLKALTPERDRHDSTVMRADAHNGL
jgi:hypothetical protein